MYLSIQVCILMYKGDFSIFLVKKAKKHYQNVLDFLQLHRLVVYNLDFKNIVWSKL